MEPDNSRVVPIYSEHKNTEGELVSEPGMGTGYLVASGLVLTAKHVIWPDREGAHSVGKQELVSVQAWDPKAKVWVPAEKVVWYSQQLDLAVLQAPLQCGGPEGFALLGDKPPVAGRKWAAAVCAVKEDGSCEIVPQRGEFMGTRGATNDDPRVDLAPSSAPKDWRGMSGGAVFCTVTGKLVAVICWEQPEHHNGRVTVTRVDCARSDAAFCRLFAAPERDGRREHLVAYLAEAIEHLPSEVLQELGLDPHDPTAAADRFLARCQRQFAAVLRSLIAAGERHRGVLAGDEAHHGAFRRLCGAFTAARFDAEVLQEQLATGSSHAFHRAPDENFCFLEARVANREGRPAFFEAFGGSDAAPVVGRSAIPVGMLEVGPDPHARAQAVRAELITRAGYDPTELQVNRDLCARLADIRDEFETFREPWCAPPDYLAIPARDDDAELAKLLQALAELLGEKDEPLTVLPLPVYKASRGLQIDLEAKEVVRVKRLAAILARSGAQK